MSVIHKFQKIKIVDFKHRKLGTKNYALRRPTRLSIQTFLVQSFTL